MISRHLVIDVEIQHNVDEFPDGFNATDQLGVACAVSYDVDAGTWKLYDDTAQDLRSLRHDLLAARRITGYNIWKFDLPVIWGTPNPVMQLYDKCDDLLQRIWAGSRLNPTVYSRATHGGFSLDAVCVATLGEKKIGHGADAPEHYKQKRWGKLFTYCMRDVWLTYQLADHAKNHNYVNARGRRCHVDEFFIGQIESWQDQKW